jgi:hypothetical protein
MAAEQRFQRPPQPANVVTARRSEADDINYLRLPDGWPICAELRTLFSHPGRTQRAGDFVAVVHGRSSFAFSALLAVVDEIPQWTQTPLGA